MTTHKKSRRGFEVLSRYEGKDIRLPRRSTEHSAGYDIESADTTTIEPGKKAVINTGLKCRMQPGEWLLLTIRSSQAVTHDLMLVNSPAVIDADYYGNPKNEGHIMIGIRNMGDSPHHIRKGDRIVQGIFMPYLTAGHDGKDQGKRSDGIGSTGR